MSFEVQSDRPIVAVEMWLEGDGEPHKVFPFKPVVGFDGRWFRQFGWKPTVDREEPYDLMFTATNDKGEIGTTKCQGAVTVTK